MSELPDSMSRLQQWLSQTHIDTEEHDEPEQPEHYQADVERLHSTVDPEHDAGTNAEEGPYFAAKFDTLQSLDLSPETQPCQEHSDKSPVEYDAVDTSGLELSNAFRRCIDGYKNLLLAVSGHSEMEGTLAFERMLEEYGRLKLWGDQNRALLPHVPGSLSSVLKNQPEILDTAQSTFRLLGQSLESANVVVTKTSALDFDRLNNLDEDSASSSASETSTETSGDRSADEPLYVILRRIYDQIEFMYQMGSIIRQQRFHDRYLHSSTNPNHSLVSIQDNEHVRLKVYGWRNNQETEPKVTAKQSKGKIAIYLAPDSEAESAIAPEDLRQRMIAEASQGSADNELMSRLAVANARRRHQFLYWQTHPYSAAPTSRGENEGEKAISEKGQTIRTFSSIAKSAIAASAMEGDANATTYAPSIVNDIARTARVPDLPVYLAEAGKFECPFCHMILDSISMKSRQTWKRHVFRDLRPYICTYQDCSTPHRMYATRYDWMYHESQMHRKQWKCQTCHEVCSSKSAFKTHLENFHSGLWNATQISILTETAEEPKSEASEHECHFCSQRMSLKRITAHIADHMEELSLFSLPKVDSDEMSSSSHDGRAHSGESILSSLDDLNDIDPILDEEHPHHPEKMTISSLSEVARSRPRILPSNTDNRSDLERIRDAYNAGRADERLSELFQESEVETRPGRVRLPDETFESSIDIVDPNGHMDENDNRTNTFQTDSQSSFDIFLDDQALLERTPRAFTPQTEQQREARLQREAKLRNEIRKQNESIANRPIAIPRRRGSVSDKQRPVAPPIESYARTPTASPYGRDSVSIKQQPVGYVIDPYDTRPIYLEGQRNVQRKEGPEEIRRRKEEEAQKDRLRARLNMSSRTNTTRRTSTTRDPYLPQPLKLENRQNSKVSSSQSTSAVLDEDEMNERLRDEEYNLRMAIENELKLDKEAYKAMHAGRNVVKGKKENKEEHERDTRPTYTRMARRHLSIETLRVYNVDFQLDSDPDYLLIKRWVPEAEQDVLWSHTRVIRERRARETVNPVDKKSDTYNPRPHPNSATVSRKGRRTNSPAVEEPTLFD